VHAQQRLCRRWGSHDVQLHGAGSKLFYHAVVGDLDLA
jgi:hypothetical protein